jgi:hypothetical protein
MAFEIRRILVRDQAKLPPFVPDPPTPQEQKANPKAYKTWLEKYHKSMVVPLQQQFREIQQALSAIGSQFGDVNNVITNQEGSAITQEVVDSTVDTAITDLNLGTAATRPLEDFATAGHSHGNITNLGAIGTLANKPIITGTSGVLQAGAFGSTSNTFCEGNDVRLSDARVPLPHTHGNISNVGAIGTVANLPLITGASGVLQASSFGSTSNTFCQGDDARLSDARVPLSHTHGNISNSGAIGVTANLPLITGTDGVLQASSFGSTSNTFCEGNDARLSDSRVPLAHASTHLFGGTDQLFNQNLNTTNSVEFVDVSADRIKFDTATTIDPIIGELTWDAETKTLMAGLDHSFDLKLGQDVIYYAENNTASAINKGVLVMFAGTTGNSGKIRIKPWDGTAPQKYIMGLAATTFTAGIGNGGYVIHFGKLRGFSTDGSAFGETWVDGDILFARPFGGLTKHPAYIQIARAGTTAINGVYSLRGMSGGKPYYNRNGSSTSTTLNAMIWSTTKWIITNSAGATIYESTDAVISPDLVTTWVTVGGASPVPVSEARPEQTTSVAAIINSHNTVGTVIVRPTFGVNLDSIGAAPLYHSHDAGDVTTGTLDNGRVNFASPGAIGSTLANTGAFTTLGVDAGLRTALALFFNSDTNTGFYSRSADTLTFVSNGANKFEMTTQGLRLEVNATLGWAFNDLSGSTDLAIGREAADTLYQRRGANPQAYRLYNTFTSATSFERANIQWASNVFTIGTEKGSAGGTARVLRFQTDGVDRVHVAADGKVGIGTTSPSYLLSLYGTDANTRLLIDRSGNTMEIAVDGTGKGLITAVNGYSFFAGSPATRYASISSTGNFGIGVENPSRKLHVVNGNIRLQNGTFEMDAGSGTLGEFHMYGALTTTTNFERSFFRWASSTFRIGTEAGSGGGTVQDLELYRGTSKFIALTSTGMQLGTATSQLLGFYGVTPVDQPVTVTDAATQDLTGLNTVDQVKLEADLTSCKNSINAIIDRLQELGLIA